MLRRIRILLVEDNRGDVYLVQQSLAFHRIEHDLSTFPDGEQAIEYLRGLETSPAEPSPDLILLDLNLPKKDGYELLEAVRKHGRLSTVPVIIVTSSDAPKDRKRAADLGANRYFRKPLDYEQFLRLGEVIKELISPVQVSALSG